MKRWPNTEPSKCQPELRAAQSLQDAAAELGFDWPEVEPVWRKIEEELTELREAVEQQEGPLRIRDELGDILFSIVNLSRFLNVDSSDALEACMQKFNNRLSSVQQQLDAAGKSWESSRLDELEALWQHAKQSDSNR